MRVPVLTAALIAAAVLSPAQGAGVPNERAAAAASDALVDRAARGESQEALEQAGGLGSSSDAGFATALARQREALETQTHVAPGRVSIPEDHHFAGCLTRRYLVRYADGREWWALKWRRGVGGWYLKDVTVTRS